MHYFLSAQRLDGHGALARAKSAEVMLDTDPAGRSDVFGPVDLLLAALAACMIKGAERVAPMLKFDLSGLQITLDAERQDTPPKLVKIRYQIVVTTQESDSRLALLHRNILKYGTISNTLALAVPLEGTIARA